jgi:hypothetical protein
MSPTFHVITVHFFSDRWFAPQRRGLDAFMPDSTRRYGVLNGVSGSWASAFDWSADLEGNHATKLTAVAAMISAEAPADDVLVFLDGDAFPVAPVTTDLLAGRAIAAVRRDENLGDRQPHPSFCMVRVGLWRDLDGDWASGPTWLDRRGEPVTDVGGVLLTQLEAAGVEWTPLLRTAEQGSHPVFFGIYADTVYHHGAGFRRGTSRAMQSPIVTRVPSGVPVLHRLERSVRARRQIADRRRTERVGDALHEAIVADPQFFSTFRPVEPPSE